MAGSPRKNGERGISRSLLLLLLLLAARAAATVGRAGAAPCDDAKGERFLKVVLKTDDYGFEQDWELSRRDDEDDDGRPTVVERGPGSGRRYADDARYVGGYCLPPGAYEFAIYDSCGDGICCEWGAGGYAGYLDGEEVFASPDGTVHWEERRHEFYVFPERPDSKRYDAVIVGAGWAGLSAARTLLNAGVTSILVLEADERVGGRAKSVNGDGSINVPPRGLSPGNVPTDLGCEWLYMSNNDMEPRLRDGGFIDEAVAHDDKYSTVPLEVAAFYFQYEDDDGNLVAERLDEDDAKDLEDRMWGGFLAYREKLLDRLDGGDVDYEYALERYMRREGVDDDYDRQYLNLVADAGEVDYAGDADSLSLKEVEYFDGDIPRTHYKGLEGMGFGNVAASFAENFRSKIRLNARVTEVRHVSGASPDTVSYVENGKPEKVEADAVLVTVSLGVLKSGSIQFSPSGLPAWKQEVVDAMGFGTSNKAVLTWNKDSDAVWPRDRLWFELITPNDASSGRWTTFFNPTAFKGVPTLVAWIAGKEADRAERHSDARILRDVMANLRSMFPSISRPDKVVITRWGRDENTRGSYSFKTAGRNYREDAAILRKRMGRIWFAGEATAGGWYATTVGAWESGQEAALDMVSILNK